MVKLIGIYASVPQSGKTTIAETLAMSHGFWRMGFADSLKRMLASLLRDQGLSATDVTQAFTSDKEKPLVELGGKTPRQALQSLGTDWGRNQIDSDLWVRSWSVKCKQLLRSGNCVVADDVRFPQEILAIRALGGKVIRVCRPNGASTHAIEHASEGGLDHYTFDAVLINNALHEIPSAVSAMLKDWEHFDV